MDRVITIIPQNLISFFIFLVSATIFAEIILFMFTIGYLYFNTTLNFMNPIPFHDMYSIHNSLLLASSFTFLAWIALKGVKIFNTIELPTSVTPPTHEKTVLSHKSTSQTRIVRVFATIAIVIVLGALAFFLFLAGLNYFNQAFAKMRMVFFNVPADQASFYHELEHLYKK